MALLAQATHTVEEMRHELESISKECRTKAKTSDSSEAVLLRAIAESADASREGLLDISVAMTRYVTYCLEKEEQELVAE